MIGCITQQMYCSHGLYSRCTRGTHLFNMNSPDDQSHVKNKYVAHTTTHCAAMLSMFGYQTLRMHWSCGLYSRCIRRTHALSRRAWGERMGRKGRPPAEGLGVKRGAEEWLKG